MDSSSFRDSAVFLSVDSKRVHGMWVLLACVQRIAHPERFTVGVLAIAC